MPCQCADARRAYCESACKPSSVPRLAGLADTAGVAAIRLHRRLPDGSSDRTRGPAEPADLSSYWSCSGWGLPGRPVSRTPVGSYPHHFTFAGAFQLRLCLFCGTLLRVAPTGRYPAPCSAELGLSSTGRSRRDCLADSAAIVPGVAGGITQRVRTLPPAMTAAAAQEGG